MNTQMEPPEVAETGLQNEGAVNYFTGLLGRTLRVAINDGRTFVGGFKCTDRDRNIILEGSQEYRPLSEGDRRASGAGLPVADARGISSPSTRVEVLSRFVGLIVIPGEHIKRIDLEEFDPAAA